MPGQRIDAAGGIAQQRRARPRHGDGNLHHQRIGEGRAVQFHPPGKASEAGVQLGFDLILRQFRQRLGRACLHVPRKVRPVAGQGQRRKRAFRCEQLPGNPFMRPGQFHICREDGLSIRPPLRPYAEGCAHRRIDPVTGRNQSGAKGLSVCQGDVRP